MVYTLVNFSNLSSIVSWFIDPNQVLAGNSGRSLASLTPYRIIIYSHCPWVTKELAELSDVIAWAEKEGLIEIDVEKAAYKLTEKGKRRHASYIEEAQDLILRYDIFADVDVDSSGQAHFDSNLGRDLRVAIYEIEGINPYRARFLLGLNDGEWDKVDNWTELISDEKWYREIFAPVDSAPSVDDVGQAKLQRILDEGKAKMRHESRP